MPPPSLSPQQLDQVAGLVAEYIIGQRNRFYERAAYLSVTQKSVLTPFFRTDVLEMTRVLVLTNERIGNPTFYPLVQGLGFSNLPDFARMAAITFNDVVVSHEPFTDGLLFHELVHVEQYRQLGMRRFAELYVRGFVSGGGYDGIPLEINAYGLGNRFEAMPRLPFSVESEVTSWIQQDKF